jgi:hypothetical protein
MFEKDILGLEKENIRGVPLLVPVVKKGVVSYRSPGLEGSRRFAAESLARLPPQLKKINRAGSYPVEMSRGLKVLRAKLTRTLRRRQ